MIRDHANHGALKEPMNPCSELIHRFLWCTMIRVIFDHWSWSRSFQKNAPWDTSKSRVGICCLDAKFRPVYHVPINRLLVFLTVHLVHVVGASSRRSVNWGSVRKTADEKNTEEARPLLFFVFLFLFLFLFCFVLLFCAAPQLTERLV